MHKLQSPQEPECFTKERGSFVKDYPPATPGRTEGARWEAFKNNCRSSYKAILDSLQANQGGLCAFCEAPLSENNRQIEHFIPKSLTNSQEDWTCTFSNYTLSCKGNSNPYAADYSMDPDAHSNYTCGHKKDALDPRGIILNPYELPDFPLVSIRDDEDGAHFYANRAACTRARIAPDLVESTLAHLGLNCPNLARRRKMVRDHLLREIEEDVFNDSTLSAAEGEAQLTALALEHLRPHSEADAPEETRLPSFYTLRLLCLMEDLPDLPSVLLR